MRSNENRTNIYKRVSRIHGQMHGIMQMIEEGRSYTEIVQQISAAKSALDSTIEVIVADLVDDFVSKTEKKGLATERALEIKQVVTRLT